MSVDKQRLKELALSAPKHKLEADLDCFDIENDGIEACVCTPNVEILFHAETGTKDWSEAKHTDAYRMAEYIAALDPETVLALLEENERLRAALRLCDDVAGKALDEQIEADDALGQIAAECAEVLDE